MSFGATISVTVNAVAKVLNRINQDGYGSEYLLREATQEFQILIKHQKEALKAGELVPMERHLLQLTQTVYATATDPERVRQAYSVLRCRKDDSLTLAGYISAAQIDYVDSGTVQADLWTWQN